MRVVNRMTKDEAKECGVDNHRLHFRTYIDKGNMAPPADACDWFKLVSVDLGNGSFDKPSDSVGVVTKWEWPNPLDGVTGGDFERAAAAIRAGQWRKDIRAINSWVGIPIAKALGLSLTIKAEKAKVTGLIKVWLASGALVEVEREDEHRKKRVFIAVAGDT